MIPVKAFFTGGRAVFTIEIPEHFQKIHKCNPHYTYRIRNKENSYFVELLSGPDNGRSYSYIGLFNVETGQLALTGKSRVTESAWSVRFFRRSMANIFENHPEAITNSGFNLHHEGKCGKCGKKLTVPESIRIGLGPKCR